MVLLYILGILIIVSGIKRIDLTILSIVITYMTVYIIPMPQGLRFGTVMSVFLFLYVCLNWKYLQSSVSAFPFKYSFCICLASYVISSLINEFNIIRFLNYTSDYFFVFSIWMLLKQRRDLVSNFFTILIIYTILLCVYGAYEAITGNNPIIQSLINSGRLLDIYLNDNIDRTGFHRTKSMTIWCESYGLFCSIALFVYTYFFEKKILKMNLILYGIIIILLSFGILSTNSRTILMSAAIILFGVLLNFKGNKVSAILIASFIILFVTPNIDVFDKVYKSIIEINDSGGSSLDMRLSQLSTSLLVTKDWMFGNGLSAWEDATNKIASLYGAESIIFTTMIDRGLFGLFSVFVMWLNILIFLIKQRKYAVIFLFVSFVFAKIATLAYGVSEVYILCVCLCIIKMEQKIGERDEVCRLSIGNRMVLRKENKE